MCEAGGMVVLVPAPTTPPRRSCYANGVTVPPAFGHTKAFWAPTNAFSGTHKCPKMYLLSFRTAVHPVDFNQRFWEERGVFSEFERVLRQLWLMDKDSKGPWGTWWDTTRHPHSRWSVMEMSSKVVSTNLVADILDIFYTFAPPLDCMQG